MSSLANAFKRAAGVPEKDITNEINTPYYGRKIIAEAVIDKMKDEPAQPVEVQNQFGYTDIGHYVAGVFTPFCNQCGSCKTPNRGDGTCCYNCNTQALRDTEHDPSRF